ncbi:MAG: hypothetical protein ABIO55_06440 [Ginsengibacter sp.]
MLNLSRDFKSDDIKNYGINFDDSSHTIRIDSLIDIQSKTKAKIEIEDNLLNRIKTNQISASTYNPKASIKYIQPPLIENLKRVK